MFDFTHYTEAQILSFALVFLRVMAFVVAWPVFGSASVPVSVKLLLSLMLSVTMYAVTGVEIQMTEDIIMYSAREIAVGLVMGYMMRMFFFAINICGEITSISIGLGAAQIFNPAMGSQSNIVEQLQLSLATLLFLALNGHHFFLMGLAQSFQILPIGQLGFHYNAFNQFAEVTREVFEMGLKISAPILVTILLTNLSMGILGRAVPQVNIFVTSMPLTLLLGLGVLIFTLPLWITQIEGLMDTMTAEFFTMLKVL